MEQVMTESYILWFEQLKREDVNQVGGKNASLGEMISNLSNSGIVVPNGFATTATAYWDFLKQNQLISKINDALEKLDVEDLDALAAAGKTIRQWITSAILPEALVKQIKDSYQKLSNGHKDFAVAVRSSATAEDLPEASFAGQQETFLNVRGVDDILAKVKEVFASLFTDRAIAYRVHHGFAHEQVALSVGIQQMVRSDLAASGVLFTLDTESGFNDAIFITASYGLGELLVQGAVNPDEFYVYKKALQNNKQAILSRKLGRKQQRMVYSNNSGDGQTSVTVEEVPREQQQRFALSDDDIEFLARQALLIEQHYQCPMDVEWAKDGLDGKIYIVQARPETVQSRQQQQVLERFSLTESGKIIITGRSIGQRIGQGVARVVNSIDNINKVQAGDVLVTDMTDPDWEPVMKRAAAIVTNRGGRTCHAAIIARELGIPAVVGCGEATTVIQDGQEVTVSCAEGEEGNIYQGCLQFEHQRIDVSKMPELPFKISLNVGTPDRAFAFQALPNHGIGLARIEFIINSTIGIHPRALLEFDQLDPDLQEKINEKVQCYDSPVDYYVKRLAEGISTLAAAFYPKPVIVRLSDFKSNEYANLLGGEHYEPNEDNPMIGFRGACRYVSDIFKDCFALECEAVKHVRNEMGLTNVKIMIPFVRTLGEAKDVIDTLADNGLKRGENDLEVIMMCEIPSNAILAEQFLQYFDGFSIGSNDLTQLTLGIDRDSELVAAQFDERDEAVKALLHQAIQACRKQGKYIGICGQGPSDHPDLAKWLMEEGIEAVSLNPDSVMETWLFLAN
jgi:pyruvate,water dikinase